MLSADRPLARCVSDGFLQANADVVALVFEFLQAMLSA